MGWNVGKVTNPADIRASKAMRHRLRWGDRLPVLKRADDSACVELVFAYRMVYSLVCGGPGLL
jgi:hypothetical protein